nr:MAG TPA: hypothetical protein [Caudoviricetes sp.]
MSTTFLQVVYFFGYAARFARRVRRGSSLLRLYNSSIIYSHQ